MILNAALINIVDLNSNLHYVAALICTLPQETLMRHLTHLVPEISTVPVNKIGRKRFVFIEFCRYIFDSSNGRVIILNIQKII